MIAIILSLALLFQPSNLQEEEIWYVWLDTPATVDGKQVRLVGEAFTITCCVKSGKFSRLEKSALKWAQKNYDATLTEGVLKKIQDETLASEVVSGAQKDAKQRDDVILVDYLASCE